MQHSVLFLFFFHIMYKGECMQNQNEVHKLELDSQKRLSLSGVDSVDGFSEQILNLTVCGTKMRVSGNNIKITAYNKSTKLLSADGDFNEIKYLVKKAPLMKKIFK